MTENKEEDDSKFTWTATELSKDASFFDMKKAVNWISPVEHVRNLYFLECDDVIFQKDGEVLLRKQGSGEGVLPPNIGVKVFNGRSKAV